MGSAQSLILNILDSLLIFADMGVSETSEYIHVCGETVVGICTTRF